MSSSDPLLKRLARIRKSLPGFKDELYPFVFQSLEHAFSRRTRPGHLSGKEVLAAFEAEARDQFGPMAITVLQHWGITEALDFGRIIFAMVEEGVLLKQESDSLEDFNDPRFFDGIFDARKEYSLLAPAVDSLPSQDRQSKHKPKQAKKEEMEIENG